MDPVVHADASYATMPERKSVVGHTISLGPESGSLYAHVGTTKCAVTSIFEGELIAGSAGVRTAVYAANALAELGYKVESDWNVMVDNEAEVAWVKGDVSSKRSRHIDVHMYYARHMHQEGRVQVTHVSSEENIADILTKALAVPQFRLLAGRLLGHRLVKHLAIKGLFVQE